MSLKVNQETWIFYERKKMKIKTGAKHYKKVTLKS